MPSGSVGNERTRSPNGLSDSCRRVTVRTSRPASSKRAAMYLPVKEKAPVTTSTGGG